MVHGHLPLSAIVCHYLAFLRKFLLSFSDFLVIFRLRIAYNKNREPIYSMAKTTLLYNKIKKSEFWLRLPPL